jgi:curved DNA-binding protein CbpA
VSDLYEILELTPNASAAQIKAAYKRLAMRYHPDHNMGDKQAEEKFKQINEAYHILSDSLKKSRYDRRFEPERPISADDPIQREYNRRRYYQTHQPRSYYKVDKEYFKIQGLAILAFFIFSGICFGIAHTVMYFIQKKQMEKFMAHTMQLKQVNGLFEEGRFNEAFDMVTSLKTQYPTEFRFTFAKDSLVNALGRIAESAYDRGDYKKAIEHLLILKNFENPIRENTLQKIAGCQYYLGNYEEALRALKHLHNQKPQNFELTYRLGQINLENLDNPEEALQYFNLCKDLFKKNLKQVYGDAFELVMDPRDAPDIYFEFFVGRAKANLHLKNDKEAITDGNWAIFLRPNNPEGYRLRAIAKANARVYSEICEDIRHAKRLGSHEVTDLLNKYCR